MALKKRKMILGISSNWDSRLPPLLDKLRLRKFFDHYLFHIVSDTQNPIPDFIKLV